MVHIKKTFFKLYGSLSHLVSRTLGYVVPYLTSKKDKGILICFLGMADYFGFCKHI